MTAATPGTTRTTTQGLAEGLHGRWLPGTVGAAPVPVATPGATRMWPRGGEAEAPPLITVVDRGGGDDAGYRACRDVSCRCGLKGVG